MKDDDCITGDFLFEYLTGLDNYGQLDSFKKIQTYVLVTIFVLVLQLAHLFRPFAYTFFRLLSGVSYILVPVLISYILGLMGRPPSVLPKSLNFPFVETTDDILRYLACIWLIFLLFAYTGFDNLNAFSLEERHGRSKLLIQVGIQFLLLILVMYQLPPKINLVPMSFAFAILTFKFVGRLVALAHAAGATPRIKNDVISIINYSNRDDDRIATDPVTMAGYNYLVGSKYAKIKDGRIFDGITMEKVLGSPGRLLADGSTGLKDTGLSFALFWLLLGKFWSYPLYDHDDDNKSSSSRAKAWKFVRHGLIAEGGGHERVFRVIETELAFLREYFHARYIFFYLNGFYWKLVTIVALPAMFWWFLSKMANREELDKLPENNFGDFDWTIKVNKMVISVIVALEIIQLVVFLTSRWLKVTLLCYYVNKMTSNNVGYVSRFFVEVLGFVFLESSRSSKSSWWRKPWKREMSQYSLVESCTTLFKPTSYLELKFTSIISIIGVPYSKPGWKLSKAVKLSDEVKKAVVLCLQRNTTSPKLSNGAESLRRNEVMGKLSSWASTFKNDTKTILVWHIATSVCELHTTTTTFSIDAESTNSENMKVATQLSKYCAYLLFSEPSLLEVPSLAAESLCATTIQETMRLFKQPAFGCGNKLTEAEKYNKLTSLDSSSVHVDEEAGDKGINGETLLKTGVELGRELVKFGNADERWRILAEFWTEMILYLAPSNNNELEHAGKLSQGGEFITQLWALLIHAGIYNRHDINRDF